MFTLLAAELVHIRMDPVGATRIGIIDLGQPRHGDPRKARFIQSTNVRKVRGQALEAKALDLLQSVDRSPPGVAIICVSYTEFVHHERADGKGLGEIKSLLLAKLVTRAEGGQVAFPLDVAKLVLDVAAIHIVSIAQLLV